MSVSILIGDCRTRLRELPDNSVDSVVCDPPYHLTSIVKRFGAENAAPAKVGKTGAYARASRGFMGQTWDGGDVAFRAETWAEVLRVLKPGGHLIAFSGTRTYHRMVCAIEDAGFEVRDQLAWVYGSGFPKSLDVSKAIDKATDYRLQHAYRRAYVEAAEEAGLALPGNSRHDWTKAEHAPGDRWWAEFERWLPGLSGAERERIERCVVAKGFRVRRASTVQFCGTSDGEFDITAPATEAAQQWQGYGTALKPATEPICLARKPLSEKSVAANVLRWGTGALNIDGCRIEAQGRPLIESKSEVSVSTFGDGLNGSKAAGTTDVGRWPANLCHDGSDEVLAGFPESAGQQGDLKGHANDRPTKTCFGDMGPAADHPARNDSGSAARFFFEAKYSEDELLFHRAKAMLSAWTIELANSAEGSSSLPESHAAFALRLAATSALPEGRRLSALTGLSTAATPTELNNLATNFIAAILSFESGCLPAWLHGKHTPTGSPAPCVEIPKPTDTITITISHWKSSGCAEPVTFSITPQNSELGAKDSASARFKYCAKTTTEERGDGNNHPTVKPIALMRWLVRLVTPPGGTVLDPFMGSGSTLIAADAEQFNAIGCEMSPEYAAIAERRIKDAAGMFADVSVAA